MTTQLPLDGLRVIELASWVMAPAAAGILSAYGADVVKIEPAGSGDPSRAATVEVGDEAIEAGFELANNRKRSIHLDLGTDAGREVVHRLLTDADVFVTNVRQEALKRAGLLPDQLGRLYPQLVIAHATGYGTEGPHSGRPAFDELAYWSRGGIADAITPPAVPPVGLAGAMGDLPSAIALVAGVTMALLRRERDGTGSIVDVSLYQCGMWTNGWLLQQALLGGQGRPRRERAAGSNPLYHSYRSRDGKWVQFAMLQPDRYWRPLCIALDRSDLVEDERFHNAAALGEHATEAIALLDELVGALGADELARRLDDQDLPWSPIFNATEIAGDEQARANGYIVAKRHRSGRHIETVSPPFHLRGLPLRFGPAPEAGHDTEAVLGEAGYSWDEISRLRDRGAY